MAGALKVLALLIAVGGTIVIIASVNSAFDADDRDYIALAIAAFFGTLISVSIVGFLGYALDVLVGIWENTASDPVMTEV